MAREKYMKFKSQYPLIMFYCTKHKKWILSSPIIDLHSTHQTITSKHMDARIQQRQMTIPVCRYLSVPDNQNNITELLLFQVTFHFSEGLLSMVNSLIEFFRATGVHITLRCQ